MWVAVKVGLRRALTEVHRRDRAATLPEVTASRLIVELRDRGFLGRIAGLLDHFDQRGDTIKPAGKEAVVTIVLSDRHDPMIIATLTGSIQPDEYAIHLVELEEMTIARQRPYTYVYDASQAGEINATTRRLQAQWIAEHREAIVKLNLGLGYVFSNFVLRNALTAFHWISPPPYPHTIVAKREEAILWCLKRMSKAGLVALPDAQNYRAW